MLGLSRRLQTVLDSMETSSTLADVGTDHGLLAIAALQQGKAKRVVAVDINTQPLKAAERAIAGQGLQNSAKTLLSDGLQQVAATEMEQVVIAGMGGLLIRNILQQCLQQTPEKFVFCRRLVLQPMNHVADLRLWLAECGWPIMAETMLSEKRHFYQVIVTRPGSETYRLSWLQSHVGPQNLAHPNEAVREYIQREIQLRRRILHEIAAGGAEESVYAEKIQNEMTELIKIHYD